MNEVNVKRKPGFGRFLFGRAVFFILFTVVQIVTLIGLFSWIEERYRAYGYGVMAVIGGILAIHILNEKQNASFKMAWLIPVLLFPVFGGLFYMFVQLQMEPKILAKRIADIDSRTKHYLPQNQAVVKKLKKESRSNSNLAKYLYESGGAPLYENTNFKYYPLGDQFFEELMLELKRAKQFIFLEYFIIQPGHMWNSILEILEIKAKEGVEVRVLYDGMNVVGNLPSDYWKILDEKGIRCRVFNPVRPAISTSQNTRDHRKILVIDGKIAYTGGVNLADEYINRKVRFGHWKDNPICVRGDAVRSFIVMFLQMWNISAKKLDFDVDYGKYLEPCQECDLSGLNIQGYSVPFGDSPMDKENVSHQVYLDIIYQAREYVYMMTPYLVLDDDMLTALCYAAKRGVDTIILMPHIPDKNSAFMLAHSYYPELIEAGVKIYQYLPGFVHSKTMISDDEKAVVGSVNLDFRSQYLNFECGIYIYRNPVIEEIKNDFEETLRKCARMTVESYEALPIRCRFLGKAMRLIAPLM